MSNTGRTKCAGLHARCGMATFCKTYAYTCIHVSLKAGHGETVKNGHAGCHGERAQMFFDFNHVHGQVISGKHTTFTHAEAPLKAAIDLEE